MTANAFNKDPQAVLDYMIDWATWLGSDSIATSTWTVSAGITVGVTSHTTTTATIWLSGGTAGVTYTATNHVVTLCNREDDRTLYIYVWDK